MLQDRRLSCLRDRLTECTPSRGGRLEYPADLRAAVIAFATDALSRGDTLTDAARALGINYFTLHRWLHPREARPGTSAASPRPAAFVAVHVRDEAAATPTTPTIVVHAPGGLRIEGLDVSALATLLRAVIR